MAKAKNTEIRQKILQQSFYMFMERGYNNVLAKEIAAECSIGHPLLQHYFKKKEDILVYIFFDLLVKVYSFIEDFVSERIATTENIADHVFTGVYYRVFYGILGYGDGRLLDIYTNVLYNTTLLKEGTDFILEHDLRAAKKLTTDDKRLAIYVLNGTLAQFICLYKEAPLNRSLESWVNRALNVHYGYLGVGVEERDTILSEVNLIVSDELVSHCYKTYFESVGEFIQCEW